MQRSTSLGHFCKTGCSGKYRSLLSAKNFSPSSRTHRPELFYGNPLSNFKFTLLQRRAFVNLSLFSARKLEREKEGVVCVSRYCENFYFQLFCLVKMCNSRLLCNERVDAEYSRISHRQWSVEFADLCFLCVLVRE